jgi:hypothetical protein
VLANLNYLLRPESRPTSPPPHKSQKILNPLRTLQNVRGDIWLSADGPCHFSIGGVGANDQYRKRRQEQHHSLRARPQSQGHHVSIRLKRQVPDIGRYRWLKLREEGRRRSRSHIDQSPPKKDPAVEETIGIVENWAEGCTGQVAGSVAALTPQALCEGVKENAVRSLRQ